MLVAAPERWDEACFAVPAVRAIAGSGMAVTVLCPERQQQFWESLGGPQVVVFAENARPRAIAARLGVRWGASFTWEAGRAAEAIAKAGIPRRLGPRDRSLRKLISDPVDFSVGPLEHRVRHYLAPIEELGMDTRRPEYFAPADFHTESQPGSVLLCPDSDYGPNHEWLPERWLELARVLESDGRLVTVASIKRGRSLGRDLALALGGDTPWFEISTFDRELPLLASYALVVAADGSLPHLASHAGTTCVTLFGPNDPAWKRPLGTRHAVVRRHVECAPCLLPKCPMDLRCQRELEPARVLAAVRQCLA
jgi:ADP-heptose:LPS heptosyltransferase